MKILFKRDVDTALKCLMLFYAFFFVHDTKATDINSHFEWVGSFKLEHQRNELGDSRFAFTAGVITLNEKKDGLFISGHRQFGGISEVKIPTLIKSKNIADLNAAEMVQPFTRFLIKGRIEENEKLNTITGLQVTSRGLLVNAIEYYDADADNSFTSFIINDPNDLKNSVLSELLRAKYGTYANGWIADIPYAWRIVTGKEYLMGNASNYPIISRFSVGPSLFMFSPDDISNNKIYMEKLLKFSLDKPLSNDLFNVEPNQAWTANSRAVFGFMLPDKPLYFVIGTSAGHKSGVGYKIKRKDGTSCPGQCPLDPSDINNYFWVWSLKDLLSHENYVKEIDNISPLSHGELTFIDEKPSVLGASFDNENQLLYLLLDSIDDQSLTYEKLPIIKVYKYNISPVEL